MRKNQVIVHCKTCNKKLSRPPSLILDNVFCSQKCYSQQKRENWSKKNNPRWRGGNDKFNCIICGKFCERKKYGKKAHKNKYCSIKCSAEHRGTYQRGKNHPMWLGLGGRRTATPIRRMAKYEIWRLKILERDKICQRCGSDKELEVNHKYPLAKMVNEYKKKFGKLNVDDDYFYDIENGEVLCLSCHRKTFNEKSSLIDSNAEKPTRRKAKATVRD